MNLYNALSQKFEIKLKTTQRPLLINFFKKEHWLYISLDMYCT